MSTSHSMMRTTAKAGTNSDGMKIRIAHLYIYCGLLLIALLTLSCASTNEVVLDDEELFLLASRKLERSEEPGITRAIGKPKKRKEAIELFDQLLDEYPESPHAKDVQMQLADIWLDDEKYEEAEAEYTVFLRFYPSGSDAEKAQFRLLLTHQRRIRTYDRDQSFTHKTLTMCEGYREKYPGGQFIQNVAIIEQESLAMLAEHEFYIGRLYYRQREYAAARPRFEGVLRDYPNSGAACKALLYLAKLDLKLERQDDAIHNLERLIEDYPGCRSIASAKSLLEDLKQ